MPFARMSSTPLAVNRWLLFGLTLGVASALIASLWYLVQSPIDDIAGVEPYVVYTLAELRAGLPLYQSPLQPPFSVTQYAPLYYLLVDGVAAIVSPHANAHELTTLGRIVSAATLVAQTGLAYWLLSTRLGLPRAAGAVCVVVIVLATAPWQVCVRPDALLGLLSLSTLVCAVAGEASSHNRQVWFVTASLLAVLSVFAKQSGIVNLVSVLTLCVVNRHWLQALALGSISGAALTLGLGASFLSWGPAFFANTVTGVRNGIQLDPPLLDTFTTLTGQYLPFVVLGLGLGWVTIRTSSSTPVQRVLAVFALTNLACSSVLALKRGAAINYFNDYFAFAALLTTYITCTYWLQIPKLTRQTGVLVLTLLTPSLFVRNLAVYVGYSHAARGGPHDYTTVIPLAAEVRTQLVADNSFALTRHAGLAAALAPRALLPMPAITDQLFTDGLLNSATVAQWLAHNRVSKVLSVETQTPAWYGPVALSQPLCRTYTHGLFTVHERCPVAVEPNFR